jgi:hypothetical protein
LCKDVPNDKVKQVFQMPREMIQKIIKQMTQPLSAYEIARDIIRLGNVKPEQASLIVDGLLKGEKGFFKADDGRWSYQPDPQAETLEFIFCKVFSIGNRSNRDVQVRLAECSNFQIQKNLIYSEPSPMLMTVLNAPVLMDGIGAQLTHLRRWLPFDFALENPIFLLTKLLPKLFPGAILRSEEDISRILGQSAFNDASNDLRFAAFIEQCLSALELLREKNMNSITALETFYSGDLQRLDYTQFAFGPDFIANLPEKPGVYVMKDRGGKIIYVGKSKNLKRRLRSYLIETNQLELKLQRIRNSLYDIEIHNTGSDLQALLLEQELIQSLAPEINRQKQIQARPFRKKERYSRILLLPHFNEDVAALVFFRPGATVTQIAYPRHGGDSSMLAELVQNIFFAEPENHENQPAEEEILVSWLAQHPSRIRSIDMRSVTSPAEAVRLIQDHLTSLHEDQVIHI